MPKLQRKTLLLLSTTICFGVTRSACLLAQQLDPKTAPIVLSGKRPVTVADMIGMTEPVYMTQLRGFADKKQVAQFSLDGRSFIVVLKRGNIQRNTNDYSIVWFRTRKVFGNEKGTVLVRMSSSSNRPAIAQVEWIDNRTIAFLGEHPGEHQQLYTVDIPTKRIAKLTAYSENLSAYAIDRHSRAIVFLAERGSRPLKTNRGAVTVNGQALFDLLVGKDMDTHAFYHDLFIQLPGSREKKIEVKGRLLTLSPLLMSPDGRHVILKTMVTDSVPALWQSYEDSALRAQLNAPHIEGQQQLLYQFEFVDVNTHMAKPLLNAPIPAGTYPEVYWSPDSRSVVISEAYLPLDDSNDVPDSVRRTTKFLAEVDLVSGHINPISSDAVRLRGWDFKTGVLVGQTGRWKADATEGQTIAFVRNGNHWTKVTAPKERLAPEQTPEIAVSEDMNSAPSITVTDTSLNRTKVLVDLNPNFNAFEFGRVENLSIKMVNGTMIHAGLYFPVGYQPGQRYPLIVQTHGWNPERFWIDGPYSTAFAAQAFAGKGFVVAQVSEAQDHPGTPDEVKNDAAIYESVIEELKDRGIADVDRIGLIAFSRTTLPLEYLLVHSRFHLRAVTLADGRDVGYFRYLAYLNSNPWLTRDAEGVNGGIPITANLHSWLGNGLDFGLENVTTPVRLEANNPESLFFAWEWFVMLRRLNKAVELTYTPGGQHVQVTPENRMTSQQGNVDWFRFWLQGYQEPDPVKTDQYKRWRHLREP